MTRGVCAKAGEDARAASDSVSEGERVDTVSSLHGQREGERKSTESRCTGEVSTRV